MKNAAKCDMNCSFTNHEFLNANCAHTYAATYSRAIKTWYAFTCEKHNKKQIALA